MAAGKTPLSGDKGIALLLVVSVISLLTVIVLQFNRNMWLNLEDAWSFKDRQLLYSIAESGIDLALAVLHTDSYSNDYDSFYDSWAVIGDTPIRVFDSRTELNVTITDLSGRFQLNSMVNRATEEANQGDNMILTPDQAKEIFLRLLKSGNFAIEDDLQADEIADSVIDWLDSDDKESTYGAEQGYYEALDPPYYPRNDFLEHPNELLAIKGLTPELLHGNDEKNGLADYITVYGSSGAININTADPLLIQSFDDRIDSEQAELLVEFREDENNAELLSEQSWYRSVSGWPGDIELNNSFVVTVSEHFRVSAEATLDNSVLTIVAYIRRSGKEKLEILYRKIN